MDVENRDYHSLSHLEIGGAKRISQHLSGLKHAGPAERSVISVRPFLPKEDEPPEMGAHQWNNIRVLRGASITDLGRRLDTLRRGADT